MKVRKYFLHLNSRLSLDALRHQRGRGFGNGATFTLKTCIGNHVTIHPQVHRQSIAAKRVVAFGGMRSIQHLEVSRPTAMVDDQFLIKIRNVAHRLNNSWTLRTPFANASSSDFVL